MHGSIFIQICAVGSKRRICILSAPLYLVSRRTLWRSTNLILCLCLSFLHRIAFWPFKVVQGHPSRWFWYQSKARIRLPISRSLWLWSYLAPFSRYGDLLAKNCLFLLHFCYRFLTRRPRSLCSPWNFAAKLTVRKLVMGLSSSEDCMIVAGVVLAWYQRVTDRRSDGQTESIIAKTALCIAEIIVLLTRCQKPNCALPDIQHLC